MKCRMIQKHVYSHVQNVSQLLCDSLTLCLTKAEKDLKVQLCICIEAAWHCNCRVKLVIIILQPYIYVYGPSQS